MRLLNRTLVLVSATLLIGADGARADGYSFFSQGAKAMGLGGAFVAQADDPSAVFYNLAGPAVAEGKAAALGVALSTLNESLYQGLSPGIGAGTAAAQDDGSSLLPHAYFIQPLSDTVKLGFGLTTPFNFKTEWAEPDSFAGRTVSTAAELVTYDLIAGLSIRLSPTFGFGAGAVYRSSELTQNRRLQRFNPAAGEEQDVADVAFETDFSDGIGWTVGLIHKPSERFSWGVSYRSPIDIDYNAIGRLTQVSTGNDQLDAILRLSLPYDEDLATATSLEFPEVLTVGFAVGLTKALTLEIDAESTGWSNVQQVDFDFLTDSTFDSTIRQDFDDTLSLRAGLQYTTLIGIQLRLGMAMEESPQPDATVGPFFADADRTVLAVGVGLDWIDLAFMWIDSEQRIISDQIDDLNGNYRSSAWQLGLTLSF